MFLAINELVKERSRFILITAMVVMVSFLTYFLTSLAYGLATSYTQGIDSWQAEGIMLRSSANNAVGRSILTSGDYASIENENTAQLGVGSGTVQKGEADEVSIFGIDFDSFLAPQVSEGRSVESKRQVIVSDELQIIGYQLGDQLKLADVEESFEIVGFASEATFQTAPIVYMQLSEWRSTMSEISGMTAMRDDTTISALVTQDSNTSNRYSNDNLTWQSIKDFSMALPGYQAQVLTFGLMIGFLIGIASFVLAIFMYILTLQKKSIFGVLKAEGVPSAYIGWSVFVQTGLVLLIGLVIGVGLALLCGLLLAGKVPFKVNGLFYSGIFLLFLVCSALGSLASVRSVTKIDPVEAIG